MLALTPGVLVRLSDEPLDAPGRSKNHPRGDNCLSDGCTSLGGGFGTFFGLITGRNIDVSTCP
jgi:hypothetical protein